MTLVASGTRYCLLRNTTSPRAAGPIVPGEVEDAHELAVKRGMPLAALVTGKQHDLADERADLAVMSAFCRSNSAMRAFMAG